MFGRLFFSSRRRYCGNCCSSKSCSWIPSVVRNSIPSLESALYGQATGYSLHLHKSPRCLQQWLRLAEMLSAESGIDPFSPQARTLSLHLIKSSFGERPCVLNPAMRFAATHTSTGHTHTLRMDGKVFVLGGLIITAVQSTQSIIGNHATRGYVASSAPWRSLAQPEVRPVFVMQVDNLIPIVLNCERSVIRGIRGMGVLSGFMEHLLRVDGSSIAAVWNRTMRLDYSRYHSGCSYWAHVAECSVRRSRLLTAQHCWI